ncbi:hypothetical protein [Clostridium sp. HBUAS56010]|uniref:hypothetical protein n=1 Tax=Clostridium sp. HBUAS56010 TaxID=2571127 RepID=UPI0011775CB5|nr:hypothetical protein [Clostridium sp. HBUAS56010]
MQWNELSNRAKSIIEWVEDPRTGNRPTVEVKLDKEFIFPQSIDDLPKSVMVTSELYNEVLRFVTEDDNIRCEQFLDGFLFKLKEE